MMNDLVSIIIPIYKVEKYLKQCIESVLNQKYSNFELILVDDGSPDGCGEICDEYGKKDSRIIVIHKENSGVSSARNAGLDIAKGKYIAFVDSDDYVSELYIYNMVQEIEKEPDIALVICSYYKIYLNDDGNKETIEKSGSVKEKRTYYSGKYIIENRFGNLRIPFILAWNKLYRRELFEEVRYEIGAVHEDEFIFRSIMEQCDKVAVIDEPLVFHRIRAGSIMTSYSKINVECNMRWMLKEIEYYRSQKMYEPLYKLEHMMCHEFVSNKKCMDKELKDKYSQSIKDAMADLLHAKHVGVKTKVHYFVELIRMNL